MYADDISRRLLGRQTKYLDFKVLALGIVDEESEVLFPHRFMGFVPNLKEIPKNQLFDIFCAYSFIVFETLRWL